MYLAVIALNLAVFGLVVVSQRIWRLQFISANREPHGGCSAGFPSGRSIRPPAPRSTNHSDAPQPSALRPSKLADVHYYPKSEVRHSLRTKCVIRHTPVQSVVRQYWTHRHHPDSQQARFSTSHPIDSEGTFRMRRPAQAAAGTPRGGTALPGQLILDHQDAARSRISAAVHHRAGHGGVCALPRRPVPLDEGRVPRAGRQRGHGSSARGLISPVALLTRADRSRRARSGSTSITAATTSGS